MGSMARVMVEGGWDGMSGSGRGGLDGMSGSGGGHWMK